MDRRTFIGVVSSPAAAMSLNAQAQRAPHSPRIGYLSQGVESSASAIFNVMAGLRDYGWIDGQNLTQVKRFADEKPTRLPALAAELAGMDLDVIVAPTNAVTKTLMQATSQAA